MTAKPSERQSYANLSNPCEYLPNSDRKSVTMTEYNNIMSQIIGKNLDIDKTLIALLDEANKYVITSNVKPRLSKRRKNEQKATQIVKRVRK